ncbi:MAG: DUF512 domain-containing protein [Clostridia bacterium]|nr:DUF512 domain-containing protein [Clostridia bacterium]
MFEVSRVTENGVAQRFGIQKGDRIVSINGEKLIDYIDYVYFCAEEKLKFVVLRGDKRKVVRVVKSSDEDLGLDFTKPLLGNKRVCGNKCVFCFVDQLPKGMRKSLYVKDEDWRYSFVMGNYVTLATIKESEVKRIIKRKVSPIFVSVHTVDEELRRKMLGNERAMAIKPMLRRFAGAGISFHAQAVVCPGQNDGEKLSETIEFLWSLQPNCMSLAVVPVGLTDFREGLVQIPQISAHMAAQTILKVASKQKECLNSTGTRFVFAADEYYIKAGEAIPSYESYESFDQIENGVGMAAKFTHECEEQGELDAKRRFSVATSVDFYPYIQKIVDGAGGQSIDVHAVENLTFGERITVAGLLSGSDYLNALTGKDLADTLLISADSLKDGRVFLDDMTLKQLEDKLKVKIVPTRDGAHFAQTINGVGE